MAGNLSRGTARSPQRYRKRRPLPAIGLVIVLGVAAAAVWYNVIQAEKDGTEALACDPPPSIVPVEGQSLPTLGQALTRDSLDRTPPTPAADALVRVVNASGQNRQAGAVTETLRELGFTRIAPPDNDVLYRNGSLNCRAQIRFGQQGMSAARTLSLIEPCAELVRDDRQDATVDLAIGRIFDHLQPRPEARRVLEQLNEWTMTNPGDQGGLAADGSTAAPVEASLLQAARAVRC
ncbi:envelope integrity protein Cei [Actinokineospora iranica]|uniref:envelope integrity protein Cei n=1 Tax=Actinokineospora iranica TaxID=1271860 RepID=UPI001587C9FD|nr:envelope integrity protein Cei [Actinokineospora iranica]